MRWVVVIAPLSALATITKGADHPGPIVRSTIPTAIRAGSEAGSSAADGGPMLSAPAGDASASIPARISGTVIAGLAISLSASALTPPRRPLRRGPGSRISQRLSEGPSRRSSAGIAVIASATLRRPEMTTPIATGPSRPGVATALAASIVSASVPPAAAIVRPAVRAAIATAASWSHPPASSWRTRETISRA